MTPTIETAPLAGPHPPEALPEAPKCPPAAPSAPESIHARWVRAKCPNVRDGWRCVAEHARGRECCRLMLDPPKRCPWAERGPVLCADEAIYRAYLAAAGGPWWRGQRTKLGGLAVAPMGAAVSGALAPAPKRVGRVCPSCGKVELAPRRRLCDGCAAAARRQTWRQSKQRHREGA